MKLIYVENDYDELYGKFWGNLGEIVNDRRAFLERPRAFDLVCFTGGADVSPEVYGHRNLRSSNNPRRDEIESEIFEAARCEGIPMTGICRGSQFLNVKMGGTMVQDLRASHGGNPHTCITLDDQEFEVTSSHHQMSVLGHGGEYLARSEDCLEIEDCVYDGTLEPRQLAGMGSGDCASEFQVTEAFSYSEAKIFAVQHHPEWQDINCDAAQWTLQKIREICFGERENTAASA